MWLGSLHAPRACSPPARRHLCGGAHKRARAGELDAGERAGAACDALYCDVYFRKDARGQTLEPALWHAPHPVQAQAGLLAKTRLAAFKIAAHVFLAAVALYNYAFAKK